MVGRNRFFFPSSENPVPLGGGLEAQRGFYSSVRPAHRQLMVNVNGMSFSLSLRLAPIVSSVHHCVLHRGQSGSRHGRLQELQFRSPSQRLRQGGTHQDSPPWVQEDGQERFQQDGADAQVRLSRVWGYGYCPGVLPTKCVSRSLLFFSAHYLQSTMSASNSRICPWWTLEEPNRTISRPKCARSSRTSRSAESSLTRYGFLYARTWSSC